MTIPDHIGSSVAVGNNDAGEIEYVRAHAQHTEIEVLVPADVHHDVPRVDVKVGIAMQRETAWYALARTSCLNFHVGDRNVIDRASALVAHDAESSNRGHVRHRHNTVQLLQIGALKPHWSPTVGMIPATPIVSHSTAGLISLCGADVAKGMLR
jgi:hypothetical protein